MTDLQDAHMAALEYRNKDPKRAAKQLCQAQFFLTWDQTHFSAANRCLSWLDGIAFDTPARSGRKQSRRDKRLYVADLLPIDENNSRFDALFDALNADYRSLTGNRGVGSHYGSEPRKGKVIWVPKPNQEDIIEAFEKLDTDGIPDGFKEAKKWFVAHPDTGKPYPAKIIWGLASHQTGADFTAHNARDALRKYHLECANLEPTDIISEQSETGPIFEGAERQATRTIRERSPVARKLCIEHYRARNGGSLLCIICEMDFSKIYGELGEGFIHVHHLDQLSESKSVRQVSPKIDLVPVCPNCHAMIHRGGANRSITEIRNLIEKNHS